MVYSSGMKTVWPVLFRVYLSAAVCGLIVCSPAQCAQSLLVGGTVTDLQTGEVLSDADVVLFNKDGEVAGSCVTDEQGRWTLPAGWDDCGLKAPPREKGLLASAFGVISWPVRTVSRAVGKPTVAVIKTAARAAGGAAGRAATAAAVAGTGGVAAAAAESAGAMVGKIATEMVVGDPEEELEREKERASSAAQLQVRVWKDGFRDYSGKTGVYLLDRVEDEEEKQEFSLALVDRVHLSAEGSTQASRAPRTMGVFTKVTADPAIAPAGTTVTVTAQVAIAPEVIGATRMVARNLATKDEFELRPDSDGVWRGKFEAPAKGPYRNHEIVLVAYRCPEGELARDKRIEGRAAGLGAWDPKKPFPVDPEFLTSRNRGVVVVTVTRPEAG
jgi:hypothetical protein